MAARRVLHVLRAQLGLVQLNDAPGENTTTKPLRLVVPAPAGPPGSRCWPMLWKTAARAAILAQYDPTVAREVLLKKHGVRIERLPYHMGGNGACGDGVRQGALRRNFQEPVYSLRWHHD